MSSADLDAVCAAAFLKLRAGDAAAAEQMLAPALHSNEPSAKALQLMGLIQQAQGKLIAAAQSMAAACALAPTAPNYNNLGVTLAASGELQGAIAAFRAALKADAAFLSARACLARALADGQEGEEAEREAKALVAADPSAGAWEVYADVLSRLGRFDDAMAASDEALRLSPNARNLTQQRALILDEAGHTDEALATWERLAREKIDSPDLAVHLARALQSAGRPRDAGGTLVEALQHWPDNVALHGQLARLRWLDGEQVDFTAAMEAALAAMPAHTALRAELAKLLHNAGKFAPAEMLLWEGLIEAPRDVALQRGLISVLADQNRLKEALEVIDANPSPALIGDRAVLYLRLNRPEEALRDIRALSRRPDADQQIIALEALALRALGDPEYARLYDYDRFVKTYDITPPDGLAESLRALHTTSAHPLDQTLRNGTQTGRDLRFVKDPIIQHFIASLEAPICAYIDALSPDDPLGKRRTKSHRLSGAWSVRLKPGGFHVNHVHDRGWISSAYYVALPPSLARADAGTLKFGEPPWPIQGLDAEKNIRPQVGMLVLFPSYMWHGTVPFTDGEERLTVAFDVVPA